MSFRKTGPPWTSTMIPKRVLLSPHASTGSCHETRIAVNALSVSSSRSRPILHLSISPTLPKGHAEIPSTAPGIRPGLSSILRLAKDLCPCETRRPRVRRVEHRGDVGPDALQDDAKGHSTGGSADARAQGF